MLNPYEKYQQQMVSTMTQADMLLKLYDETVKQIDIARTAIDSKDIFVMDKAIKKAQKIIAYLISNLNHKYEVSKNLLSLYQFFDMQLVLANVKKDVKPLNDIQPLIQDLRDTYEQCARLDRSDRSGNVSGDSV